MSRKFVWIVEDFEHCFFYIFSNKTKAVTCIERYIERPLSLKECYELKKDKRLSIEINDDNNPLYSVNIYRKVVD